MAAAHCDVRVRWAAHGAASLPCGVVGEPRRKLGPIATVGLLLFIGVGFKKWALGLRQSFLHRFLDKLLATFSTIKTRRTVP